MPSLLSALFPPSPTFTDAQLPAQTGRVILITGAAAGMGFELASILYHSGATVYIAARSQTRCDEAISKIKASTTKNNKTKSTKGKLESLVVDLADLRSVKGAAENFLKRESKLDVLVHNAGVMTPPKGSKGVLGHDLELVTNCLAPYLLTILLEPLLLRTAATSGPLSVRIVFVVSIMQLGTPAGAMEFTTEGTPVVRESPQENYMQSKVGGCWLADEFAKRLGPRNILSMSLHPGLMRTELQRNFPLPAKLLISLVFKSAIYGAYSELYAGFSPALKAENNGGYIMAWGRVEEQQIDVAKGLKSDSEGGTGAAKKFLKYCKKESEPYL